MSLKPLKMKCKTKQKERIKKMESNIQELLDNHKRCNMDNENTRRRERNEEKKYLKQ